MIKTTTNLSIKSELKGILIKGLVLDDHNLPARKVTIKATHNEKLYQFTVSYLGQEVGFKNGTVRDALEKTAAKAKEHNLKVALLRCDEDETCHGFHTACLIVERPIDEQLWERTYRFGYEAKRLGVADDGVAKLREIVFEFLKSRPELAEALATSDETDT